MRDTDLKQGTFDMLIHYNGLGYKWEVITTNFTAKDVRAILTMPLGLNLRSDRRI